MSNSPFRARLRLVALALAAVVALAASEARSITYGEPDCEDNATNTGCRHPSTVSLSNFPTGPKCSGTLLAEDANRFIILTAGHCAVIMLEWIQKGRANTIGVSFDARIRRRGFDMNIRQYLLGGQAVVPVEYGPHAANTWVRHYDYAIIVFDIPEADRYTRGGNFVDLLGIPPVALPPLDYLADKVNASDPLQLTTVGYGVAEYLVGPGEGGNAGGPFIDLSKLGLRWMTDQTYSISLTGPDGHQLFTSQNPARDHAGSCDGDSGGPLFYEDEGVEYQVGITSWGEVWCRGSAFNARTDSARAVEFLACVTAPDAALEDILACGCTEVDNRGVCPSVRNHVGPARRRR
jgi:hypothetical protein